MSMTKEQIKQNAEEYYQKLDSITIEDPREPNVNSIIDAYLAGAQCADEHSESHWISPKERLPEYGRKVFAIFQETDLNVYGCTCSPEDKVWFIAGIVCEEPLYWLDDELPTDKTK